MKFQAAVSLVLFASFVTGAFAQDISCDISGKSGRLKMAVLLVRANDVLWYSRQQNSVNRAHSDPLVTSNDETYRKKIRDLFMNPNKDSLYSYWKEMSQGRVELEATLFGPFDAPGTVDLSEIRRSGAGTSTGRDKALTPILSAARKNFDLTGFHHFIVVMPDLIPGGTFGFGSSDLGCTSYSSLKTNASVAAFAKWGEKEIDTIDRSHFVYSLAHEGGHQIGLSHANAIGWEGAAPFSSPIKNATIYEYQDPFSLMGRGSGYYDASQLNRLGWLSPQEIQTVAKTDQGIYTLRPLSAQGASGVKVIRLERAKGETLWLEYRQPVGRVESFNHAAILAENAQPKTDPMSGLIMHLETRDTAPSSWGPDFATPAGYIRKNEPMIRSRWQDPMTSLSIEILERDRDGIKIRIAR